MDKLTKCTAWNCVAPGSRSSCAIRPHIFWRIYSNMQVRWSREKNCVCFSAFRHCGRDPAGRSGPTRRTNRSIYIETLRKRGYRFAAPGSLGLTSETRGGLTDTSNLPAVADFKGACPLLRTAPYLLAFALCCCFCVCATSAVTRSQVGCSCCGSRTLSRNMSRPSPGKGMCANL